MIRTLILSLAVCLHLSCDAPNGPSSVSDAKTDGSQPDFGGQAGAGGEAGSGVVAGSAVRGAELLVHNRTGYLKEHRSGHGDALL